MKLRCVYDIQRDCSTNIALDEVFFVKENFEDILKPMSLRTNASEIITLSQGLVPK